MLGFGIVIILLILMIIFKKVTKYWISPSFIMITYWSLFIIFAILVFGNDYDWNYIGLLWIIFACVFFGVGYVFGTSLSNKKITFNNVQVTIKNNKKDLSESSWKFILICIIIGLLRVVTVVVSNGFSFGMFFDIDSLINMNTSIAHQRYYGEGSQGNIITQVMLVFVYAAPLCGGYAFVYAKEKSKKLLSIATFLPIIGITISTNGKAGLIASVFLWLSGFFVSYIEKYKSAPRIRLKLIIKISLFGVLFFGLLYLSMFLRIGAFNTEIQEIVNNKFKVYALGHIPAFDHWFYEFDKGSDFSLGGYTFLAIYDMLGLATREQGVFKEMIYFDNGLFTNVFTAFRGVINDFGIIGALIFIMLFGFVAGYCFNILLSNKKQKIIATTFLTMTYFFILHSFTVSPWSYLSYIFSFLIFIFYLWLTKKRITFTYK
ncbi:O-antigen polymerase [Caldifermentibacillus hisashii]|uniref:O-antigen polymerase n=1 Tax=Caldifermentibacillus hisashii TaxID=996558 RepID=UPI003D20E6DB